MTSHPIRMIRTGASAGMVALALAGSAAAQELVYTPVNPSFGGNPFNSAHLLGTAIGLGELVPVHDFDFFV